MSNLLEQASLVMIPSGYKEDIVYSVIPTSGAGDLTFTRASNGTRIDSDGNVEVVPWNLLQYSEDFSTADWNKQNLTITTDATTAPNGITTADKAIPTTSNTSHGLENAGYLSLIVGATYTASFYAKASGYNFIQFLADGGDISGNPRANFNLSNGTLGSVDTGLTASIESVGNGWYRCVVSFVVAYNVFNLGLYISDSGTASRPPIFSGNGTDGVFIWGAQLNIGSTAKPYFPTTDRLNVPRLTYQNGGGGCPSLLLEKQSTNVITTNIFTNWAKLNGGESLTSGIVDPAGTTQAYRLSSIPSGNYSYGLSLGVAFIVSAGSPFCYSVYLKGSGTIAITAQGSGFFAPTTITLTSVWTRYDLVVSPANAQTSVTFYISNATGTTATSVDMAFPQAELGSYCTSYIFTSGSSATRVADACFKTGISSLIGQTEGTIYVDLVITGTTGNNRFSISDGSNVNWIFIGTPEDGATRASRFYIKTNNSVHVDVGAASYFTIGQRYQLALAYKSGDWAVYGNGTLLYSGTNSIASVSSPLSVFNFFNATSGSADCGEQVNEAILFPTRLTNSELAQLTGNQNYTINQAYESYGVASESPNCVQP